MWEFLQTYGLWILLGLGFFWLMSRAHGHGTGGGCCGPGHEVHSAPQEEPKAESQTNVNEPPKSRTSCH